MLIIHWFLYVYMLPTNSHIIPMDTTYNHMQQQPFTVEDAACVLQGADL